MEPEVAGRITADAPSALVDEPMMGLTQEDQVVGVGRSRVRPVRDVMGLQPAFSFTAPETTRTIAELKLAHEPRRNATGPPADPDGAAVLLHHPLQRCRARQPPDR